MNKLFNRQMLLELQNQRYFEAIKEKYKSNFTKKLPFALSAIHIQHYYYKMVNLISCYATAFQEQLPYIPAYKTTVR